MVAIAKNVFWSLPIASQHQNSKIWLHHYTRHSHTYHVSKYEEDRGSVEKQRSLNIYKFGGRRGGGGGGRRQPRDLSVAAAVPISSSRRTRMVLKSHPLARGLI